MLESTSYSLKIKFINPILGSQPGNETPASDFIRKKVKEENPEAQIEDEIPTLPTELEKGTTGFHVDENGNPICYNYQVKGGIKDAAEVLNGIHGIKNFRSKIDNYVMVSPRTFPFITKEPTKILERPIRMMTMQGPRTALSRSQMIAAGATIECVVKILKAPKFDLKEEHFRDLLDYSSQKGFGQWRNSGAYGQYEYELNKIK